MKLVINEKLIKENKTYRSDYHLCQFGGAVGLVFAPGKDATKILYSTLR